MSIKKSEPIKVGFWYSKSEPDLPMPEARVRPWKGQGTFMVALGKVEAKATKQPYKGFSNCRLCGVHNGIADMRAHGFLWPSGLIHYVESHNVKPPAEFIAMVLDKAWRKDADDQDDEDIRPAVKRPVSAAFTARAIAAAADARALERVRFGKMLERHLKLDFVGGEFRILFDGRVIASASMFH